VTPCKRGTCRLCLNEGDLQQSHYLGRALYRLSSDDGELPILMSPDLVIQDQKQIRCDTLRASTPCIARTIWAIDTDTLAYCALSVIWRGGAHIWRTFEGRATGGLPLGHHEERLHRYLLGTDPYPQGVVKISVSRRSLSSLAISTGS
jgi:hypothetical protein